MRHSTMLYETKAYLMTAPWPSTAPPRGKIAVDNLGAYVWIAPIPTHQAEQLIAEYEATITAAIEERKKNPTDRWEPFST